jgi:hypothetical protein
VRCKPTDCTKPMLECFLCGSGELERMRAIEGLPGRPAGGGHRCALLMLSGLGRWGRRAAEEGGDGACRAEVVGSNDAIAPAL